MENGQFGQLSALIVREYLRRKGYSATMDVFDSETQMSQSTKALNSTDLIEFLRIEKLSRRNKEDVLPLPSILEVIVKYFLDRGADTTQQLPLIHANSANLKESPPVNRAALLGRPKLSNGLATSDLLIVDDDIETETIAGSGMSNLLHKVDIEESFNAQRYIRKSEQLHRKPVLCTETDFDDSSRKSKPLKKPHSLPQEHSDYESYNLKEAAANLHHSLVRKTSQEQSVQLLGTQVWPQPVKMSDAEISGGQSNIKHAREWEAAVSTQELQGIQAGSLSKGNSPDNILFATPDRRVPSATKRRQSVTRILSPTTLDTAPLAPLGDRQSSILGFQDIGFNTLERPASRGMHTVSAAGKHSSTADGAVQSIAAPQQSGHDNGRQREVSPLRPDDLQLPHLLSGSRPMSIQIAMALKKVVLGSALYTFSDEWLTQGFFFSDIPKLEYGLTCHRVGPSPILAAVQAVFLQEMLFGTDSDSRKARKLSPEKEERSGLLATSLAKAIWRAGAEKHATLALPCGQCSINGGGRYKADGITEQLVLTSFDTKEELQKALQAHIHLYSLEATSGVITFLYSLVLSRGIDSVAGDLGEESACLLMENGACSQGAVNLVVTGRATINTFNGNLRIAEDVSKGGQEVSKLRQGIFGRCDIGLLSLAEHYKQCQVGTYLKTPRYPVWLIHMGEHYSVLFSTKQELVSDWKAERRFDVYYYDGFARQDYEIRLTIDTTAHHINSSEGEDAVPPLELCIGTKWADTVVHWNNVQPLHTQELADLTVCDTADLTVCDNADLTVCDNDDFSVCDNCSLL